MPTRLLEIGAGLFAVAAIAVIIMVAPYPVEWLEGRVFDFWFKLRGPIDHSGKVAIVSVDGESIDRYGKWAWPRDLIASLTEKICARKPAVVVFDITFSHRSISEDAERATDSLARVAERYESILFPYYFVEEDRQGIANLLAPPEHIAKTRFTRISNPEELKRLPLIRAKELIRSSEKLTADNRAGGHISKIRETDKSCRRDAHILNFGGTYLPSMALTALQEYYLLPNDSIRVFADSGIQIGNFFVPMDENGCGFINYYGKAGTFPTVPAYSLLEGNDDSSLLRGKIVVIGLTQPGLSDIYRTPYQKHFPTAEKLAASIDNSLTNRWLQRQVEYGVKEFILIIATGILLAAFGPLVGWKISMANNVIISAVALVASYTAFLKALVWLQLATLALQPWLIFGAAMAVKLKFRKAEPTSTQ